MAAFEVIALDTATPQLRAPGASDTYTFPRAVEMPLGTANGVLYLNGSKVVSSGTALTFDGSTFGMTVNALFNNSRVLQWKNTSGVARPVLQVFSDNNLYIDSEDGAQIFRTLGSEQMRLDSTGLGIGTTPANKLHVTVSAASTAAAAIYNTDASNGNGLYVKAGGSNSGKYALSIDNAASSSLLYLDASGNLGLGVTPSAWTSLTAQQIAYGSVSANISEIDVSHNAYFSSTGWKYISNGFATNHYQAGGDHIWRTAASGNAGDPISFTQAMTLEANGNLSVGTTDTTAVRFKVQSGSDPIVFLSGFSGAGTMGVIGANPLAIYTNGSERARITSGGNFVVGTAALATTATDGFLYVPTCAGTPTGTPTTQTGTAPIVVDTTNNKLYFYSGGQWRDAGP